MSGSSTLLVLSNDLIIYSFRERKRAGTKEAMNQSQVRLEIQYSEAEYLAANRLLFFSTHNVVVRLIVFGLFLVAGAGLLSVLIAESFVFWVSLL
ncbi:MAG TPA: hypothetical protein VF074_22395, partial [Pyrinomonadaceae bacterium]